MACQWMLRAWTEAESYVADLQHSTVTGVRVNAARALADVARPGLLLARPVCVCVCVCVLP